MGLILAAAGAIGSTLHDQWKEAIRCESLDNNTLMKRVTTPNGVISNGSTVIVGPGQCAVIYDNGRVVDASAEEGVYTFDTSGTPSFFAGQFGAVFKEMWQRFTYNGATAKQQAVFFFNIKEIIDNNFGTPTPVMFQDWSHPVMNARTNSYDPLSVRIRCHGKYTFKIADPAVFMQEIAGTADVYTKDQLVDQMQAEVLEVFNVVLNGLGTSAVKTPVLELPSATPKIKEILADPESSKAVSKRGIEIVSYAIESISLDEKSQERIDEYQTGGDQFMQAGVLTESFGAGVRAAGENANGAAAGMMGVGMMNMMSGGAFGGVVNNQPQYMQPGQAQVAGVKCPNCGANVTGKFCTECGTKVETEAAGEKVCPECGAKLAADAKFCMACGKEL